MSLSKRTKKISFGIVTSLILVSVSIAIIFILKNKITPSNFQNDLMQIKDVISHKSKRDLNKSIGSKTKGEILTKDQLGIHMLQNLNKGINVKYKVNTPYNSQAGIIRVDVILKKGEKTNSKTIYVLSKNIPLAHASSISPIVSSTKRNNELNKLPKNITLSEKDILGKEYYSVAFDVKVTFIIKSYNNVEGRGNVVMTLTNKIGISITKNFTVVASDSRLREYLSKIYYSISTKDKEALNKIDKLKIENENVSASDLGYKKPAGLPELTYRVKEAYNNTTGKIKITVSLTKSSKIISDIIISAKDAVFNYDKDLEKIVNYISSKNAAALNSDMASLNFGDFVKPSILGYKLPQFSSGVKAYLLLWDKQDKKIKIVISLYKTWEHVVRKEITIFAKDAKL